MDPFAADEPVFDEALVVDLEGEEATLVIHRDPQGVIVAHHSPLTHGTIRCTICEGGARVYLR